MTDGVCVISADAGIVYMNDSAKKILDCESKDPIGKWIRDIIKTDGKNKKLFHLMTHAVYYANQVHEEILEIDRSDGTSRILRVCLSIILNDKDTTKSRSIIIMSDLTDQIKVHKAFERYTSKEIANQVLNEVGGDALGGRLKDVTILMSDLRGFTALCTGMSADNVVLMVNNYFKIMADIIAKYDGTIMEFLGDGIFVVFGAPIDNEKHANLAVACALEMENAMKEVNRWNAEHSFPKLKMGIGINSGVVVVGNIGSMEQVKYGCIGDNVNIAGRVESCTVGGQIYISEKTKAKIDVPLTIASSRSYLPKGAKKELKIYDVVGIGGEYNVSYEKKIEEMVSLKKPIAIEYKILVGKEVEGNAILGEIIALSSSYAVLNIEQILDIGTNLLINTEQCSGDIYAKIIEENEEGYTICLTSKPVGYEKMCELVMEENK